MWQRRSFVQNRQSCTAKVTLGPPRLADHTGVVTLCLSIAYVEGLLSPPTPHTAWGWPETSQKRALHKNAALGQEPGQESGRSATPFASVWPEKEMRKRTFSLQLPGAQALGEVRFPTPWDTPNVGKRTGCQRPGTQLIRTRQPGRFCAKPRFHTRPYRQGPPQSANVGGLDCTRKRLVLQHFRRLIRPLRHSATPLRRAGYWT